MNHGRERRDREATLLEAYEIYRTLEKFGDDSRQANDAYNFRKQTADGMDLVREYGESHFKQAVKKWHREGSIQSVDPQFTLQELKRLRKQSPSIALGDPFHRILKRFTHSRERVLLNPRQSGG